MKTALAIVCSLVLAWTQIVAARAEVADAGHAKVTHACCQCGKASCCARPSTPESQSFPAAPAPSQTQNQLLSIADFVAVWTIPATESQLAVSPSIAPDYPAAGAPLYTRNCAFLI